MRTLTSLPALSSFRHARVRICSSLFASRLLFFVLALWACCSSALAASNYVGQATVFLGAPQAPGAGGQFGPLSGDSGCLTTNTIASGFAVVQCSTDGVTWQTAPLIMPTAYYGILPNSGWIGCPGLSSNASGLYQATFVLPLGFTNASLTIQVLADNAATVYLNGNQIGAQIHAETNRNFVLPAEQYTISNPSAFFAGTNILFIDDYNFNDPSGLDFVATVSYQPPPLPTSQWKIKDESGAEVDPKIDQGHMIFPTDGTAQAIASVINATEIPTFSITGPPLGCTIANIPTGAILTYTNQEKPSFGTVTVTATFTNTDTCVLATNFMFDLVPCDGCQQGSVCDLNTDVGSVDIRLSLGPSRVSAGQAILQVKTDVPNPTLGTPQLLHSDFVRPEIQNITNASGLRQVSALDRIVDIQTNSATSYSLLFYDVTNRLAFTNGLYQLTNSPFRTVTIELVGGDTNHVRVTDSLDPATSDYFWQGNGWALTKGGGLSTKIKTVTTAGSISTKAWTIQNAQSVVQSARNETWQTTAFGDRLVQEVTGSGPTAHTNNYTYNTIGLLDTVTRWDGSWDIYQYDSLGRQTNHFSAFTNAAPTTNSNLCRRVASTYTNSVVAGSGDDWTLERFTPRQVIEYVNGTEIGRRYIVLQTGLRLDVQCPNPGASWNDTNNLITTNYLRTDSITFGQPSRIIRPDKTMQLFVYDAQPHPALSSPPSKRIAVWTGAQSGYTNVVDGTLQQTWFDQNNRIILEIQTDVASSIVTSSNFYSYDARGNLTNTVYLDGTQSSQTFDCCHLLSATDRDGTDTTFTYDALHRLLTTTRVSVTTSNAYDSVGNILATVRFGNDGSPITTAQTPFDNAGQQTSSTDALSNLTKFTNYLDASSQLIRVTTNQDQTTRIETYARDGALMKVSGTSVHGVRYEYGTQSDGGFQRRYTKEIKLDNNGNDTTEWTKTLMDGAGRAYKVIYSDNAASQSFFNTSGQLVKQTDPDGVSTLFQYNGKGELEYTALDVNTNGVIDFAGTDRITRTVADVIANAALGANVRRTRTYVWDTINADVASLITSAETSVDDLHTWNTTYRDGSTSLTNRLDISYLAPGFVCHTNTAANGSYTVSQILFGRLFSNTSQDSLNNQLSSVTYAYDPHGRQSEVTDARNGTTIYGYNNADMVTSVTAPDPGNGQNLQTTFTYYNSRLQVSSVTAPDGVATTYEYYPSGELKRTYGGRTYPVGYSYDYAGRVKTLTNWTSFASTASARVTTWNYNSNRGWLDNKRYDNNTGPDYTYTAGGRLRSRVWARTGTGGLRIATTNTYGFNDSITTNQFPDLVGVTYANDPQATPSVTDTYDRRGRVASVIRNGITTTFSYNNASQTLYETNSGGTPGSWWVTNTFDTLLRRTGFQAKAGSTVKASYTLGYDNASRIQSVSDGTNNATYTYLVNSPLVGQVTLKSNAATRLTVTKSYDYLNRLLNISSAPSAASSLSFGYGMNDANQRIQVTLADGSFWLYDYDNLGQVTSGKRYWPDWTPVAGQQFEYVHDDIGNRTSTKAGGDENGANLRAATYTANNLNQYTNRTVPSAVDIMGVANAAATVTVNNQATYRHGEFYRKELSINNASAPQSQSVTNKAVQGTTTNTVTGNVFLPQTPELFSYDADGNLTNDGHYSYSWDAENRLLFMQTLSALPVAAWFQVQMEYDWMGRRIRKTVSTNNGHKWSVVTDTKFIYDGWNCVVEANASDAVQRRYMWGLDLSGSEQGAGGVGGLLAVQDVSGTNGVNFVAPDANGNVAVLVRAKDGTVSANYEYGPFGEVLRSSGAMAKVNSIRFSTKYQDDESDLLYYGYRYYNPSTGRWISRDPSPSEDNSALFNFVRNDPMDVLDMLGMYEFDFGKGMDGKDRQTIVENLQKAIGDKLPSIIQRIDKAIESNPFRPGCCRHDEYEKPLKKFKEVFTQIQDGIKSKKTVHLKSHDHLARGNDAYAETTVNGYNRITTTFQDKQGKARFWDASYDQQLKTFLHEMSHYYGTDDSGSVIENEADNYDRIFGDTGDQKETDAIINLIKNSARVKCHDKLKKGNPQHLK
jgi:RHS repeat-associated protein